MCWDMIHWSQFLDTRIVSPLHCLKIFLSKYSTSSCCHSLFPLILRKKQDLCYYFSTLSLYMYNTSVGWDHRYHSSVTREHGRHLLPHLSSKISYKWKQTSFLKGGCHACQQLLYPITSTSPYLQPFPAFTLCIKTWLSNASKFIWFTPADDQALRFFCIKMIIYDFKKISFYGVCCLGLRLSKS